MKEIKSRTNPEIKQIVRLHQAKYRTEYNKFIAEGLNVVSTLIASGMKPIMLYVTQKYINDFITQPTTLVTDQVMQKLSTAQNPSGIVGVFEIPQSKTTLARNSLVLARIADPGNMGTLIRSAAAFGIKSVVCIEGADPWAPKVIQSSAGTIGIVCIHQISWPELVAQNLKLCALVVKSGKDPQEINLSDYSIVVGSEAHGIAREWLSNCQEKLTLPMPGNTESLNAAVAGSIALYVQSNV